MTVLSEKSEGILVGVGSACGAAATAISQTALPQEIKLPIVATLGAASAAILAFWYGAVNKKPTTT